MLPELTDIFTCCTNYSRKWRLMPCILLRIYWRFDRICCLQIPFWRQEQLDSRNVSKFYQVTRRRVQDDRNHRRENICAFFSMVQKPNSGVAHLTVEVSRSHTIRHTYTQSRYESSELVISSSQRPLLTRNTTNSRDEHPCPIEIRTRDPRNQAVSDLRLRPHGH